MGDQDATLSMMMLPGGALADQKKGHGSNSLNVDEDVHSSFGYDSLLSRGEDA